MKATFTAVILILVVAFAAPDVLAQGRDARLRTKGYVNPQEIVSLDSTMRMDQAMLVLGELSRQFAGKIIIDLEKRKSPIGVYIVNQHWRDALEMILNRQGLWYEEETEFIRIVSSQTVTNAEGLGKGMEPSEPPPTLDSRDVKISAVFFTANLSKLQEYGISWDFFRNKSSEPSLTGYVSAGIGAGDTLSKVPPAIQKPSLSKAFAVLRTPPEFTFANIDALVKFFGQNQIGDVVTSPEVIVRNNKKGKIQVGKDIFITTRDIAGNTVNQQLSTGTIIEVTPVVYSQSDTSIVYLDLSIEQSDAQQGVSGATPTITKNLVKTHALLFDGEETIIGGLYTTVESESREGVPILKDLPWWFFGLRYIFGSETKFNTKQELIVLLKAELVRPIRERISLERLGPNELIKMKRSLNSSEFDRK
jgi:type IV pilus assembly protein PilQ